MGGGAKYYTTTHYHPFSWSQVASAVFQRYPNPFATHVLSEDTMHRELIKPNVLYTRRFITKTNKIPKWGEKFLMGIARYVPLVEESFVDTKKKTVTTYTRNVGLSRFMTAVEKVVYSVDPSDPQRSTIAVKEAWVESGLYGIRSAVKNFGIERFKKNCDKASQGLNHVLHNLIENHKRNKIHFQELTNSKRWLEIREKGYLLAARAKAEKQNLSMQ